MANGYLTSNYVKEDYGEHHYLVSRAIGFVNNETEIDFKNSREFRKNFREWRGIVFFGHGEYSKASFFDTTRGKEVARTSFGIKYDKLENIIINPDDFSTGPRHSSTTLDIPLFQDEERDLEILLEALPKTYYQFKSIVNPQKLALPNRQQVYMKFFPKEEKTSIPFSNLELF